MSSTEVTSGPGAVQTRFHGPSAYDAPNWVFNGISVCVQNESVSPFKLTRFGVSHPLHSAFTRIELFLSQRRRPGGARRSPLASPGIFGAARRIRYVSVSWL